MHCGVNCIRAVPVAKLTYKERILKIADEILAMCPGTHLKAALREAKAIAKSTRDLSGKSGSK